MSLDVLKNTIFTAVDASHDEALLQDVVDMLQGSNEANEVYYRNSLKESIRQADAVMLTPASEVHKMVRQWISK